MTGGDELKTSEKIVLYRNRLGMTQVELAKTIGVSLPTLSRWERDITEPSHSFFCLLAKTLSFSDEDRMSNPPLPPRRKRKTATLGAKTETVL